MKMNRQPKILVTLFFAIMACNEPNNQPTETQTIEGLQVPPFDLRELNDQQRVFRIFSEDKTVAEEHYVLNDIILVVLRNNKNNEMKLVKQMLVDDFLNEFKLKLKANSLLSEDIVRSLFILTAAQRYEDANEICRSNIYQFEGDEEVLSSCASKLFIGGDLCNSVRFYKMLKNTVSANMHIENIKILGKDALNDCDAIK